MSERLKGVYQRTLDKTYLGYWDVPEDEDLVLTIDHFEKNDVRSTTGTPERKHICYFKDSKPMIVNKTNLKLIAQALGSDKFEDWEGQAIALYAANVPQSETGKGLRVRPVKPRVIDADCDECHKPIKRVGEYSVNKIVEMSKAKYGRKLCWDCALKQKEAE